MPHTPTKSHDHRASFLASNISPATLFSPRKIIPSLPNLTPHVIPPKRLITDYFPIRLKPSVGSIAPSPPIPLHPGHTTAAHNKKKVYHVHHRLLHYDITDTRQQKITSYTTPLPTYELYESWGHSLPTIDPNTSFRLFLQTPTGSPLQIITIYSFRTYNTVETMEQPSFVYQRQTPTGIFRTNTKNLKMHYTESGLNPSTKPHVHQRNFCRSINRAVQRQ